MRRGAGGLGVVVLALVLGLSAPVGAATTPFPPPTQGTGAEPTAGVGVGAGVTFRPSAALATYDAILHAYVLYLTNAPLSCSRTYEAKAPYLTVSVVTAGTPLVVGAPSVQHGTTSFVQVDFFTSATHYYAVQPGVRLVLTKVSATRHAVWHGRLTVRRVTFEHKVFSFSGTFAASWCGKV
ncbi:MAG TPA: hypothetical protein VK277_16865 [Acidimicrobiales bacterium]|nr:hypothetical protein [Acidimicrobiales bacterium]